MFVRIKCRERPQAMVLLVLPRTTSEVLENVNFAPANRVAGTLMMNGARKVKVNPASLLFRVPCTLSKSRELSGSDVRQRNKVRST